MTAELDSIVSVTITATTVNPSRAGFGVGLIAAYHTVFGERVREYSSLTGMVTDGFTVNDPAYKAAQAYFGQNPRPATVKIGRRALAFSQSINFTPSNTTEGFDVGMDITSPNGTVTNISRVNGAAETPTTIATALTALVTAIADLTATDNTGDFDADADNAGELFRFSNIRGLDVLDQTADPGIATDLAAIEVEDSNWYGLALDSNSKAEIAAAAAWVEGVTHIFAAQTADAEVLADTAGNIMETLEAAAYGRTFCMFNEDVGGNAGAAWLGKVFPYDAGTVTWAFKTLAGITADDLTTTETSNIESNNGNHYQSVAGVNITRQGTMSDGDFIDVQRTIDALTARIQEDVFAYIASQQKVPYTNAGVNAVLGIIRGILREYQNSGALDPETAPTVTAPLVENVSSANRAARILPDVEFTARLAGAIHKVTIQGTLTV